MKKILILSGYACKSWIWNSINFDHTLYEYDIIDWPRDKISAFHSLDEYVEYLYENNLSKVDYYDSVIGHSMGGLIGLYLAAQYPDKIKKLILVESYILSPTPFFQNLVYVNNLNTHREPIENMLREESPYYSEKLPMQLRALDLSDVVYNITQDIYAFYGDRGEKDNRIIKNELGWNKALDDKINVLFICDSCHFPMLENSLEFNQKIIKII
ncbi:alpha/beta fold hydrolase [Fusibacter sp. 3D3]|uniref:alpha/beta fold hydrolase n=1 Tax=Fusibacter sp. 3D3 TaxID=1048380 RepID=UPI0008530388|nr:alpha/beta hydrolase [Fusibacter sp. 3D3]GAU78442.1 hypothetical protein F3D3_3076 [Fusibacter sp. 3D3]